MPRGPLDILKKVLGMHAQVVTKPSLATSGQLTIRSLSSAKVLCPPDHAQFYTSCISLFVARSLRLARLPAQLF